ncbi:MAG: hypothetical protein Faunusvirus2_14 [Faunusvirus sp.]|jgi:ankyrin repeat protein|uniref:Uncharacterized protein n=1 Tax=Faunusvirus sp. TaxID=2487766 RepID=A0A3G4ZVZ4_9VIRU|nr:MAG: hypothetical protein Faunusvirus2_14 [Faunusvirus sp.]
MNSLFPVTDTTNLVHEFLNFVTSGNEPACIEYIDKHKDFYNTVCTWSPLAYACYNGLEQVADKLIDVGADVNLYCFDKYTPLILTCMTGQISLVKKLIEAGADVNMRSESGCAALSYVMRHATNSQIAILLIEAGAEFVERIDHYISISAPVVIYIRSIYKKHILSVINDNDDDNAIATSFRTTYVPELVDMICEFIL